MAFYSEIISVIIPATRKEIVSAKSRPDQTGYRVLESSASTRFDQTLVSSFGLPRQRALMVFLPQTLTTTWNAIWRKRHLGYRLSGNRRPGVSVLNSVFLCVTVFLSDQNFCSSGKLRLMVQETWATPLIKH